MTATPMWNKPLDFCGYLSLLWTEMVEAQSIDASQVGFDCLPIILRLTCLCREPAHTMVGANGATVEIGGDIPPLAITTVELRCTRTTQVTHDQTD